MPRAHHLEDSALLGRDSAGRKLTSVSVDPFQGPRNSKVLAFTGGDEVAKAIPERGLEVSKGGRVEQFYPVLLCKVVHLAAALAKK